jgi:hypothetical protein
MNIGLDYDGTITADPDMWRMLIPIMHISGHNVYIVTMREPKDQIDEVFYQLVNTKVYYTSYRAKRQYMLEKGLHIDIWIDDCPELVVNDLGSQ